MAGTQQRLTRQEEAAMIAIWKAGKGLIRDILDQHEAPQPHYNTLVSTIKNLEKKKYVGHKVIGISNEYFPLIQESDYKKQFLTTVVKNHFSDSYKDLVTFFAKEKKISAKELKEIIELIEKKK
jgi:BlaI family transcriptional regulator, penicillinase repressor